MAATTTAREQELGAAASAQDPRQGIVTPAGADTAVVRAERLSKRFGDVLAVDDLTFALERGTVTGFLGPNGAGKTTTLRMLLHLVQPTRGRALVFGRRYQDLERPASRVGAVLEAADFHPGRSGRDHLFSLALALGQGGDRSFLGRERAAAPSCRSGARPGRADGAGTPPCRRLLARDAAAARARGRAARRPGAADPRRARQRARPGGRPLAARLPARVRRRGKTVLVSSHVLAEVAQTVDQVVIINKGRLVTFSPLAELTARTTGGVRVRAPEAARLQSELERRGDPFQLSTAMSCASRVHRAPASARSPTTPTCCSHELVPESSSLEDVFLELTAEEPS